MTVIRKISMLGAAAAVAASFAMPGSANAASAEHKWKMAASWGGGPLMEIGAKAFADKVKFLTDGRVEIKVFPSGQLSKGLEVRSAVAKGVAEAGHTWMGYDWGKDKTTVLFGGYAGSMDSERMLHWIYESGGLELWRDGQPLVLERSRLAGNDPLLEATWGLQGFMLCDALNWM